MDVTNEALGWRVLRIIPAGTSFTAHAYYSTRRSKIRGVLPPFDYTAMAKTAEAAKREVLRLAAMDKDWPLMLDTNMPGVHDWDLGKDGKMVCLKCSERQQRDRLDEPCSS